MNSNSIVKQIDRELRNIFINRFGMDFDNYDESTLCEHFLGSKLRMEPRELLYLFTDIEEVFGINIPESDIISNRFTNFNNVAAIIYDQLVEKEKQCG